MIDEGKRERHRRRLLPLEEDRRRSYLISVMAILHGRNKASSIPTFTAVSM